MGRRHIGRAHHLVPVFGRIVGDRSAALRPSTRSNDLPAGQPGHGASTGNGVTGRFRAKVQRISRRAATGPAHRRGRVT